LSAECVSKKELLKSISIWRRYGQKFGGTFFVDRGVCGSYSGQADQLVNCDCRRC